MCPLRRPLRHRRQQRRRVGQRERRGHANHWDRDVAAQDNRIIVRVDDDHPHRACRLRPPRLDVEKAGALSAKPARDHRHDADQRGGVRQLRVRQRRLSAHRLRLRAPRRQLAAELRGAELHLGRRALHSKAWLSGSGGCSGSGGGSGGGGSSDSTAGLTVAQIASVCRTAGLPAAATGER